MCTLSWRPLPREEGKGYLLLFNRDEQKSREAAEPPRRLRSGDVEVLAPRDGRAGGTWVLATRCGFSVAILNHSDAAPSAPALENPSSRGRLVLSLGACRDLGAFRAQVPQRCAEGAYPPFLLFGIGPSAAVSLWRWDGRELGEIEPPANRFLTTSSYRSAEVIRYRQALRDALGADPGAEGLRGLHLQHDPERAALSIRMRRADTQTVSYSEIRVDPTEVRFRYRPETIDDLRVGTTTELTLRRTG